MELDNGMRLEIHKNWYNKSHLQEDGKTYKVDTEHKYPIHQLEMTKMYFDIEDKIEVVDNIIADLQSTIQQLQQLKAKEQVQEDDLNR